MASEKQPNDDLFARLLEQYEQTLSQQTDATELGEVPTNEPLKTRLELARECLRILKQAGVGSDQATPLVANRFGKYQLMRRLGQLNSGLTYLAFDTLGGRRVVLKVVPIRSERLYEQLVAQFQRLVSPLHPHALSFHEVGRIHGLAYLARPYVHGLSLADWLARQKQALSPSLAVQVGLVLCETIGAIHAQGLLHRNLKPSNVLLRLADPASPTPPIAPEFPYHPLIVDFDMPSWAEMVHSTLVATSIEQLAVYLAPEQIERSVEPLTPAVDVYGLGGLLYEMLAGRYPFAAPRLDELVRQILQQPPPPLSRLGVPVELEQIVSTCLRKQPQLRYLNVQRLADDLRRVQAGQKPVGVPLGFWHRLTQFWRQRKRS